MTWFEARCSTADRMEAWVYLAFHGAAILTCHQVPTETLACMKLNDNNDGHDGHGRAS